MHDFIIQGHTKTFQHPEIQWLFTSGANFDVTIVYPLFNEVGYYLSQQFNSSLILLMPSAANSFLSASMGYLDNPSIATSSMYEESQLVTPSLTERTFGFIINTSYKSLKYWLILRSQENVIEEFEKSYTHTVRTNNLTKDLGKKKVNLAELEEKAAFGFYFSHWLFDSVRPTLPNTVDIGMIHCRDSQ